MKVSDFLSELYLFFNDFIGMVVPALVLATGMHLLFPTLLSSSASDVLKSSYGWLIFLVLSYASGHVLLAIHSALTKLIGFKKVQVNTNSFGFLFFKSWVEQNGIQTDVPPSPHDLRNIAMSVSAEAGEIARRFMFIGLSCYGTASALLVLLVTSAIKLSVMGCDTRLILLGAIFAISTVLLLRRGAEFEKRALNTPFVVAVGQVLRMKTQGAKE